ncbi:Thioredoxin-like protein CXXS1 [Bienertia sinuspersici]
MGWGWVELGWGMAGFGRIGVGGIVGGFGGGGLRRRGFRWWGRVEEGCFGGGWGRGWEWWVSWEVSGQVGEGGRGRGWLGGWGWGWWGVDWGWRGGWFGWWGAVGVVVAHFMATWCMTSVAMNPFFEDLALANPCTLFISVDMDEVLDGVVVDMLVGANPQEVWKRAATFVQPSPIVHIC